MPGEQVPKEGRYRLRLSIRPNAYHLLEELSDKLDMDMTAVATFAFSLGLRQVAALSAIGSVVDQAVAQQVDIQVQEIAEDVGLPVRQEE